MKIFTKLIVGLALCGTQVAAAPLDARQSIITSVDAAVNRLLSRILTEVYNLNTALTSLTTLPPSLPPSTTGLTTVQNDIESITANLEGVSAILANATATATAGPTGCGLSVTDVAAVLSNLGMAQSVVGDLEGTLAGLTPGQSTSLTSPLASLETAVNTFNEDLQSYTGSLVPCISEVAPTLLAPVETALAGVGNSVTGLLGSAGLGGVVGSVVGSIP